MKSRPLYKIIDLSSILGAVGTVAFMILTIIGAVIEHRFRGDLFASALILTVVTVILRALSDIGTRLTRMEAGQMGTIQALESLKREHKG